MKTRTFLEYYFYSILFLLKLYRLIAFYDSILSTQFKKIKIKEYIVNKSIKIKRIDVNKIMFRKI